MENDGWARPSQDSIRDWPAFLNTLSWPTENRYVVLFNEPNHAQEWGGEIDPEDFARTTVTLAKKLKEASADYFILPAGLDVSASTTGESLSADIFLKKVKETDPEYFEVIDGWTSHSYPNPAFSAPPTGTGRGSLRSYQWEIEFLRSLGITRNLPVLIGETGWSHKEGLANNPNLLSTQTIAGYMKNAGESVWKDKQIFAVIPFLYDYQSQPFDIFSWKKIGGGEFYDHYFTFQALSKTQGTPKQHENYTILNSPLPEKLVAGSLYQFPVEMKNNGQAIISSKENYFLSINDPSALFTFTAEAIPTIEPDQTIHVLMSLRTPEKIGNYDISLQLLHGEETFPLTQKTITVIPPPALKVEVQLGWKSSSDATKAAVLVYDGNNLLQEFNDLSADHGIVSTPGILSIVPGQYYRIVTIIPYYLPRQSIQQIGDQVTVITNNRFLPFDINNDQHLSINDLRDFIRQKPSNILPRFFGP